MKKKIKKIISVINRYFITKLVYFNTNLYMKKYTNYLKKVGINISEKGVKYIAPSVYFDGSDYSLIHIGLNVTISTEVMLLTHDYSLTTAFCSIGQRINRNEGEVFFRKPIVIGDDTFIGARVLILGGSNIGNNCIIGAGTVVKGNVPDGSIVVGNPARIIGKTEDFAKKHIEIKDYFKEC